MPRARVDARVHLEAERTLPFLLLVVGATGSHVTSTIAVATEPCVAKFASVVVGGGLLGLVSPIDAQADSIPVSTGVGLPGTRSVRRSGIDVVVAVAVVDVMIVSCSLPCILQARCRIIRYAMQRNERWACSGVLVKPACVVGLVRIDCGRPRADSRGQRTVWGISRGDCG